MSEAAPKTIYLKDHTVPEYSISDVKFIFNIEDDVTTVHSTLNIVKNDGVSAPLVLDGENMTLLSVTIDGEVPEYSVDDKTLRIENVPERCVLEIENTIDPANNTALEGLYQSGEMFCTQNEPHGFRRITYFLDRPDVMSKFTTKIIADKEKYPVLLSNGNEVDHGDLDDGKHYVTWEDPFLKPSYLFALVAGDLGVIYDTFTTMSGRDIDLRIYCDKGNEKRCHHAMSSLKNAMKWDEDTFGLECDLDTYMIVAVSSFNMGAMENKGLNIFNASCVLADADTATDAEFLRVEGVVGHEYFHNWTGNRVTCRDWFQLTLKEGLTVFRDHAFSGDMFSRPVQRIKNVEHLRSFQFPEDSGPTAHPIKPSSYMQINNFYTATVYQKGSEIIGMISTLLGEETFKKGITKYFELYDGQAVTTEDFVHAMEVTSGRDLTQFKKWYSQVGTPRIAVSRRYNAAERRFSLTIKQHGELHFPLSIGLLDGDGNDIVDTILEVTKSEETFVFDDIAEEPAVSLNRHFSAPLIIEASYTYDDYIFLMAHDNDPFARWDAGQELSSRVVMALIDDMHSGRDLVLDERYIAAFAAILDDADIDDAFKAVALSIPSEGSFAEKQDIIDYDAIHAAREFVCRALAEAHEEKLLKMYHSLSDAGPYTPDATAIGRRSLKNTCLAFLAKTEKQEYISLCYKQYEEANNMTDNFSALAILSNIECEETKNAIESFYEKWHDNALVIDKWLAVQVHSNIAGAVFRAEKLMEDAVFDITNPNKIRAVIGAFIGNSVQFNSKDGSGYTFLADKVLKIDKINPLIAAALAKGFKKYAKLDDTRKGLMKEQLKKILATKGLSSNTYEITSQCYG